MSTLYDKERGMQRRLITMEGANDDFLKLDLEQQVKKYVTELQSEINEWIHANYQSRRRDIKCSIEETYSGRGFGGSKN